MIVWGYRAGAPPPRDAEGESGFAPGGIPNPNMPGTFHAFASRSPRPTPHCIGNYRAAKTPRGLERFYPPFPGRGAHLVPVLLDILLRALEDQFLVLHARRLLLRLGGRLLGSPRLVALTLLQSGFGNSRLFCEGTGRGWGSAQCNVRHGHGAVTRTRVMRGAP